MQWYVLRVAANKEMQVKDALVQKVDREGLTDIIGRIEVPVERIKRIRGNKQTVHKRKLYPGYVFMEMESTKSSGWTPIMAQPLPHITFTAMQLVRLQP